MLKYLLPIYLLLSLSLSAEILKDVKVEGNNRVSAETIKVYGDIVKNKNYTNFDLDLILKNLYETNFFEDIKLSLNNGILKIKVKEYSIINSISLEGEDSKSIKKKVLESLNLKNKESFIENKLNEDLGLLKKIYSSMGFNFVKVEVKVERFDENRINLIYALDKGTKTNISEISFAGDKKIKEKRLREVIVSEEMKFWKFLSKNTFLSENNIKLDKRLLVNYYKGLGYYDVQVLSDSAEINEDKTSKLTYTINAGLRYRINKIETNVSDVLNKKTFLPLEKTFTKIVGKYYSPFTVKKLLDELDLLILSNDLQFIEHDVNEILDNGKIAIKINIYEGSKELVERINIVGNKVTDEAVIRSSLLLDEGDPFNFLKLEQSVAKIKARNIFSEVNKKITNGTVKNQKIIEIAVEEKPTGEISAGAGVGTNGANFGFKVSENNWLGKGINVSTNLDIGKETFTGSVSVFDPNYNFLGNSLEYYVRNTSNNKPDSGFKNNIIGTGIGTNFEQYRNVYISPGIDFSRDVLEVQNTATDSLKKQKGTFTDLTFNYGVSLDNRDKAYAPTDGSITSFNQTIPLYADSPFLKNSVSFSTYKGLTPNAIGTFKFHASAINGLQNKDVRVSKRLGLGSNKLRGFEAGKLGPKDGLDYIGGNYAMAANFEVALPNLLPESTKTDVGLFFDLGNLWEVDYGSGIDDSNKIRSSVGVNTSWSSPLGPMTFVFSNVITKASTDITEAVNFKLGTTF
jgi:outer membrane protein insertion porin family